MSEPTKPEPKEPACYIEQAPTIDVLYEQLSWLLSHRLHLDQPCSEGCSECKRLEQVKAWLLTPFYHFDTEELKDEGSAALTAGA
jgi:hypothetical protein